MNPRRLRSVGALLPIFFSAGPLAGQGLLQDARLTVSLPVPGEVVRVEMTYRLLPEPGVQEIPLSALVRSPAQILSLRASVDGEEATPFNQTGPSLRLEEVRDHFMEGLFRLPVPAAAGENTLSLQLTYLVRGAWKSGAEAVLPLVVPRWIPKEPGPRTFLALVEPPAGYTITESFPTSVLARPTLRGDSPSVGQTERYEIGLQGVPA